MRPRAVLDHDNRFSPNDDADAGTDNLKRSHSRQTARFYSLFRSTMLPARFTRTFVFVVLALLLIASLLLLHEPTRRTYVDPYTGIIFDDGGVQGDYIADEALDGAVLAGKGKVMDVQIQGAHGGVIMSKLGNETAK